ncbi:hypothetical protein Lepto7376_3586 [[Leptolyngbya] sp. PCC 7376]|uniref:phospholipase D-like domain-containing protein n=1 Tax=[Leptolyngbya] sp. PCC 7376 TaxID=111781 RepID=UPI00029F252D|nr:phospholipase D-like domain-containing protein [[Leptolyngbya] sp. PCC 7376]AFY39775.1 hypothetical protein Lepto7376_3586 [[Leptolyngbya] sp. PCC 7376]
MPQFLTTSGTSYHIERIVTEAKKNIVFLSPYLKLSQALLVRLQDADRRGVKTLIIFSQNHLNPSESELLSKLKNLRIKYLEKLHSRCYFNRNNMLITSMDLSRVYEQDTHDTGILINQKKHRKLYKDAYCETSSIFNAALDCQFIENTIVVLRSQLKPQEKIRAAKNAFCIRCYKSILFRPSRPFCPICYLQWSQLESKSKKQKYCHECGLEKKVSVSNPRCKNCCIQNNICILHY